MGMPKIEFRTQMFRGDWDQIWSQKRLLILMEALVRINQSHIKQMKLLHERGLVPSVYPSVYRSGLHYESEKNTEIWPDIPSLLMGTMGKGNYPGVWGDCLPISTLVLNDNYDLVPIGSLKPGDKIMGDGGWTGVLEHAITGEKPILAFKLNNGSFLRCSPEHRLFLQSGEEIRAKEVKPGDLLLTPTEAFPASDTHEDEVLSPVDFAWLVGVYVADGWHEFPRHHRFSISGRDPKPDGTSRLKRDKTPQKLRVKSIAESAKIETYWHEKHIRISDTRLTKLMSTAGGHAPEKRMPFMKMSLEQVKAAVEGLAADATVSESGTVVHGTTSPALALQLRILYRILGQSVHIRRWDDHGGLGTHPIYRVTVRANPAEYESGKKSVRSAARVVSIGEEDEELCCDITTDTGKFYLPESDLIVHNCEDLACYRVAELRENEKVKAKPYAKWRRGPEGNYHYHALVWLPDGRLEDPSLVLGMGREAAFAEADLAEKFKSGELVPRIQYAKKPDVIAVDPEKPSGFTGGIASRLDAKVLAAARNGVTVSNGDLDDEAYDTNVVMASEETDVDAMIGWNQDARCFVPKTEKAEVRRLMGYANHNKR